MERRARALANAARRRSPFAAAAMEPEPDFGGALHRRVQAHLGPLFVFFIYVCVLFVYVFVLCVFVKTHCLCDVLFENIGLLVSL